MYIPEARFALWADFIERTYLDEGFKALIEAGTINGATSNPAIFKSAILTSPAYKEQLETLSAATPKEKYEAVAIFDIQKAADILMPLYEVNDDGYVSIEVDPFLCDDAEATIAEGIRLHEAINRPNVMIKVPATPAGYKAMEALASKGIAVNATLIFSLEQAIECAKAFERASHYASVDSVISVFVSRIDRAIDEKLRDAGIDIGLTGIYNAAHIYNKVEALKVPRCRVLFASTGVKGDDFKASYYIEALLGANSVNTAPIATIDAFVQDGVKAIQLPLAQDKIDAHMKRVADVGIAMNEVIEGQIQEGLEAFKVAFDEILSALK